LTFFDVELRGFTVMFVRWVVFGLVVLPLVGALHSPKLEQKMSTMLSFDLRRKTKHHRQRSSSTTMTPTPAPKTDGDQEEMEFTLRVCLFNEVARTHKRQT